MKKIDELMERVPTLLHEKQGALSADEIATALSLRGGEKKRLQGCLHALMKGGQIVCIRGNRYALGMDADLVPGVLHVLRSGHGIVTGPDKTVFIPKDEQGTALPGDRVLTRLDGTGKTDRPGMKNGAVIRILERARHDIVGTLRSTGRFYYVVPVDPAYGRDMYVPDPGPARVDDRVVCRFVNWENKHVNPEGVVVESIGPADDPSTDTLAIIKHYGLPERFPEEVLHEAETVSGLMEQPGERLDLRGLITFTIDPVRARDFDDALSFEPASGGGMELGVHIADVSHFVRPGSLLDTEAARRGNSVYLPDSVLPMLPEQLSNGICSLRPDEDRLAFSVFMILDDEGAVRGTRFGKSVIRSQARLTYEQAMAVIDGKAPAAEAAPIPEVVRARIVQLHQCAQTLRRNRFGRFALDLDMPECEIVMGEGGRIRDVRVVRNDASHQLVEECMVAANEAVARELSERGVALISRLHEPPKPEKIEELTIQLQEMGYAPGDLAHPRNLAAFLLSVEDDPLVMHVRMAVLRSLNRALYSAEKGGHFGLAKTYYAHFTSPIRRYPDLVVHRQLEALLNRGRPGAQAPTGRGELMPVAENCSMTEQIADEAERALDEIKKYRYLQQQVDEKGERTYEAVVVAVMNFGVFVELVDLQLQGLVHVSKLSDQFLSFDQTTRSLRAGKLAFRVGTRFEVSPVRVDFDKRQIDFAPASAPRNAGAHPSRPPRPGGGGDPRGAADGRGRQPKPERKRLPRYVAPGGGDGAKRGGGGPSTGNSGGGGGRSTGGGSRRGGGGGGGGGGGSRRGGRGRRGGKGGGGGAKAT